MTNLHQRVNDLGNKIAALELELKDGKEKSRDIVDSWQEVILEFADDFHIRTDRIDKIRREITQMERKP